MKQSTLWLFFFLITCFASQSLEAQNKPRFSVDYFGLNQLDLTARDDRYKKEDHSGSLYAIIKVSSTNPDENLNEYVFDFGLVAHNVVEHDDQLWIYVQRNAKHVTITRKGYASVNRYDLKTTIQPGLTYEMRLSATAKTIYSQMVMFAIQPADSKAVIMVQSTEPGSEEEMLGIADETGMVAKNMRYGTYSYRVVADGYKTVEGQITLNDEKNTHKEVVSLKARFAQVTLTVDADADIYVNNELKGRRTWTGRLMAGNYSVECRQASHRNSSQTIVITENQPRTITLPQPTPITGKLSLISQPLGASILIDGKDYGTTPRNITDLLIGQHQLVISKSGYEDKTQTVEIREGEASDINVRLSIASNEQSYTRSLTESLDKTPNSVSSVNKDLQKEIKKKKRTANKLMAWGIVSTTIGTLCILGSAHDNEDQKKPNLVGVSTIAVGVGLIVGSVRKRSEANKIQRSSIMQSRINISNKSTLFPSIDILRDQASHQHTLGLSLNYTF